MARWRRRAGGRLAGCLAGRLAGWMACWLAGWGDATPMPRGDEPAHRYDTHTGTHALSSDSHPRTAIHISSTSSPSPRAPPPLVPPPPSPPPPRNRVTSGGHSELNAVQCTQGQLDLRCYGKSFGPWRRSHVTTTFSTIARIKYTVLRFIRGIRRRLTVRDGRCNSCHLNPSSTTRQQP